MADETVPSSYEARRCDNALTEWQKDFACIVRVWSRPAGQDTATCLKDLDSFLCDNELPVGKDTAWVYVINKHRVKGVPSPLLPEHIPSKERLEDIFLEVATLEARIVRAAEKREYFRRITACSSALSGKWTVFVYDATINAFWKEIAYAVAEGLLGHEAKVAANPNFMQNNTHVVCLYVKDYRDTAEAERVLTHLVKIAAKYEKIPVRNGFKPNAMTYFDSVKRTGMTRGKFLPVTADEEERAAIMDRARKNMLKVPKTMHQDILKRVKEAQSEGRLHCGNPAGCPLCGSFNAAVAEVEPEQPSFKHVTSSHSSLKDAVAGVVKEEPSMAERIADSDSRPLVPEAPQKRHGDGRCIDETAGESSGIAEDTDPMKKQLKTKTEICPASPADGQHLQGRTDDAHGARAKERHFRAAPGEGGDASVNVPPMMRNGQPQQKKRRTRVKVQLESNISFDSINDSHSARSCDRHLSSHYRSRPLNGGYQSHPEDSRRALGGYSHPGSHNPGGSYRQPGPHYRRSGSHIRAGYYDRLPPPHLLPPWPLLPAPTQPPLLPWWFLPPPQLPLLPFQLPQHSRNPVQSWTSSAYASNLGASLLHPATARAGTSRAPSAVDMMPQIGSECVVYSRRLKGGRDAMHDEQHTLQLP